MKNETVRKLQEMRLSVLADSYIEQAAHPEKYEQMTFDERLALLIDREYDAFLEQDKRSGRRAGCSDDYTGENKVDTERRNSLNIGKIKKSGQLFF